MALAAVLVAGIPPAARAAPHVVRPGETLWSIAAANDLTTRALAGANGLSETARLLAGQTIQVPAPDQAAGAESGTRAYMVQAGDTLSGVALRSGVSTSALADLNGIDEDGALLAGAELVLPPGAPAAGAAAPEGPLPTSELVSPALVGQIAAEHGVSPSLAAALAKQESGFNNGVVSSADARGVMQLLPGTWAFVQGTLAGAPLDPASAAANVHAGVLYLGGLLAETGGDERLAVAAYYQGLASVRRIGLLAETERYVANVMALRAEF